jgi:hypothetical protein
LRLALALVSCFSCSSSCSLCVVLLLVLVLAGQKRVKNGFGCPLLLAAAGCCWLLHDCCWLQHAGHWQPSCIRSHSHHKEAHSGAKLRLGPAATTCAKASRKPVEGHILSTWRHTKFPDRSRLVHTAASSRPALTEQRRGQWAVSGQGFT